MSVTTTKNPFALKCPMDRCKCVVFQSNTATRVKRTPREKLPAIGNPLFKSPKAPEIVNKTGTTEPNKKTDGDDYWMVTDVMAFDNVGVSHTKDGIKYLSCADCDLAPIGYHDTKDTANNKKEYLIAVDRVVYKQAK